MVRNESQEKKSAMFHSWESNPQTLHNACGAPQNEPAQWQLSPEGLYLEMFSRTQSTSAASRPLGETWSALKNPPFHNASRGLRFQLSTGYQEHGGRGPPLSNAFPVSRSGQGAALVDWSPNIFKYKPLLEAKRESLLC